MDQPVFTFNTRLTYPQCILWLSLWPFPASDQITFLLRLNKLYHTFEMLPFSRHSKWKRKCVLFCEKWLQEDRIRKAVGSTYNIAICFLTNLMWFWQGRIVACAPAGLANSRPLPYLPTASVVRVHLVHLVPSSVNFWYTCQNYRADGVDGPQEMERN